MSDELSEIEELHNKMAQTIIDGELNIAVELANFAVEKKMDIVNVIEKGFTKGIQKVGVLWEEGEYFLPELMRSAEVMKAAMGVLLPKISEEKRESTKSAKIIIGTVSGDIHDIGKTIVGTMLVAHGFDVEDLGADVPLESFVKKVKVEKVDVICLSALLTTTMNGQRTVIEMLKKEGLRDSVKVIVGGAPVDDNWAMEIGADGYGENAITAVNIVKEMLGR